MGGANWTGGRMNTAKARSRNAANRVEKKHFANRSLQLAPSRLSAVTSDAEKARHGIDLAAARRELGLETRSTQCEITGAISAKVRGKAPASARGSAIRGRSSFRPESRILDFLEEEEATHAELTRRILRAKDMAGLRKDAPIMRSAYQKSCTSVRSSSPRSFPMDLSNCGKTSRSHPSSVAFFSGSMSASDMQSLQSGRLSSRHSTPFFGVANTSPFNSMDVEISLNGASFQANVSSDRSSTSPRPPEKTASLIPPVLVHPIPIHAVPLQGESLIDVSRSSGEADHEADTHTLHELPELSKPDVQRSSSKHVHGSSSSFLDWYDTCWTTEPLGVTAFSSRVRLSSKTSSAATHSTGTRELLPEVASHNGYNSLMDHASSLPDSDGVDGYSFGSTLDLNSAIEEIEMLTSSERAT